MLNLRRVKEAVLARYPEAKDGLSYSLGWSIKGFVNRHNKLNKEYKGEDRFVEDWLSGKPLNTDYIPNNKLKVYSYTSVDGRTVHTLGMED